MVSFQCDGCSDVVKKPKLDQHRFRCNASFTCIDCSKTFPTPADWKGHTSCITEAEKYEKSLYKPKNSHDRGRNANFQGRNGKFNNNNASWNKGTPRSQATGANDTPLGTPIRMSPITTTENEAKQSTPNGDSKRVETSISPSGQKRKAVEMSSDKPSDEVKEEIKSSKKRKSDVKEVDHTKTGGAGADTLREVNPEVQADAGKKKDRKMDEINGKNEGDSNTTVETDSKVKQKKEKKRKKNEVSGEEGTAEIADETAQVEDKGKQEENQDVKLNKSEKKKKGKSTKKDGLKDDNDENVKPGDVLNVKKEERKKKKIDKDNRDGIEDKDIHTEKEGSKLDESSPAKIDKEKSKRSKKRKQAENDEEPSVKIELAAEKKKRKKD